MALAFEGKPVFITDSGDNVTSGATGWNTFVLRQVLAVKELNKRFLFATICDPAAYEMLAKLPDGTETNLKLGVGYDEYSAPVTLEVVVKSKGELRGFMYRDHNRLLRHGQREGTACRDHGCQQSSGDGGNSPVYRRRHSIG